MSQINRLTFSLFIFLLPILLLGDTLENIKKGDDSYDSGEFKKALTYYLSALDSNPNSTTAMIGYGYTSLELGSLVDAMNSFQNALRLEPNNTKAKAGIGLVYLKQNKGNESRKYLEDELKKNPYDQNILLALSEVYENLGKVDLATFKLESARSVAEFKIPMLEKLGELYILQNKLTQSEKIAEEIIKQDSSSLVGYRLLAKIKSILAYRSNPSSREAEQLFQQAMAALDSALTISEKDPKTLEWKAKLFIWKSGKERLEAEKIIIQLKETFPSSIQYSQFLANLAYEKDSLSQSEKKLGETSFQEILKKNDLDELIRFQAEEFAMKNFPTESSFRKKLGLYRLERHQAEKNSLNYQSSLFHLYRARDLIPNHPNTRNLLIDAYKNNSDLIGFINLLSQMAKDDPGNFKIQNKLEYSVNASKKTLEYKEGLFSPTNQEIKFQNPSSIPKLLVLDFHPQDEMSERIHSPSIIRLAMNLSLSNQPGVRLAGLQEEKSTLDSIKNRNQSSYNPYHDAKFFDLNQSATYAKDIRFICIGKFKDTTQSIQIEIQIYDRKTGKYSETFRLRAQGRSSLAFLTTSLAEKIQTILPKEGNILRVKKEGVIVNLGVKNKITKDQKIIFLRNDKEIMKGSIQTLGDTISLVKPDSLYWERDLATGDSLIVLDQP